MRKDWVLAGSRQPLFKSKSKVTEDIVKGKEITLESTSFAAVIFES